MMVREVSSSRLKLHEKQARQNLPGCDPISLTLGVAHQELIEDRGRMSFDYLFLDLVDICQQKPGWRGDSCISGNFETQHHRATWLVGGAGKPVFDAWRQIHKV